MTHTMPIATTDAVLFTVENNKLKALVHQRPEPPFEHQWALPGGYFHIDTDQNAQEAIERIVRKKTGLDKIFFEQLFTMSGSTRDPRGWSLSVVFMGLFPEGTLNIPKNHKLIDAINPPTLAFDHQDILEKAVGRLKGKGAYSTLPANLIQAPFSLGQLQKIYEIILQTNLETSAFRRKIKAIDILEPVSGLTTGRGRPGKLWKLKRPTQTFDKRSLRPI